ncbi:hypothetical protein GGF46_001839 [Coemansia sp. RSA 552]|nr:hypothetical protein GGF46_001839 [Coemansia sp. RSA 552]
MSFERPDDDQGQSPVADSQMAALVKEQLNLDPPGDNQAANSGSSGSNDHATGLSPSASSMLRVLLPSLTRLDNMLESVWSKQDTLNEVLNRLSAELEQFDELILPPGVTMKEMTEAQGGAANGERSPVTVCQQAAVRLKESRAKIININMTLKRVRSRLDNVSMLAQAKILQAQQPQDSPSQDHHPFISRK